MQIVRKFLVTTQKSLDGVVYTYEANNGLIVGIEIREENMSLQTRTTVLTQAPNTFFKFLDWAKESKAITVTELTDDITFDMFWNRYNDKLRSSKKRSQRLWEKLSQEDRVKAFFYIKTYNRNRGNAEKKYCETYLNAELCNN